MKCRWTRASLLLFGAVFLMATPTETSDPAPLTVHEWGTFTSIAGEDGSAVDWQPLQGPQDLPCFVDRLRFTFKSNLSGTVRMETPVLYFYAPEDTVVDVSVQFRQGLVTEWFPRATVTPAFFGRGAGRSPDLESSITWKRVLVAPRATPDFPAEPGSSHYYAARETAASPLQVGSQKEKFLFYRGVGRFAPPVTAVAADGSVLVRSAVGEPIGDVILFENRGGRISYRVEHAAASQTSILESRVEDRDLARLRRELQRILVAQGLYPDEAVAMIETWRDSWFEEGTRLFYLAPKKEVDTILPLEIRPVPQEVARVFVGRVELVTPRILQEVERAILSGDHATFRKYGRFIEPIVSRILAASAPADRPILEERLKASYDAFYSSAPPGVVCR